MKDKSNQQDKDTKEGPNLQVAGPGGEITAGMTMCYRVDFFFLERAGELRIIILRRKRKEFYPQMLQI